MNNNGLKKNTFSQNINVLNRIQKQNINIWCLMYSLHAYLSIYCLQTQILCVISSVHRQKQSDWHFSSMYGQKKKSYNMMFIIKQPLRNHNCNVFKLGSIKKPVWMLFHYFYLSNIKTLYTLSRKSLHISQKKQSYWVVLNRAFRSWRSDPCDIFKTWRLLMIPVVVKVLQRRDFFLTAGSVTHRPRCKWVDWVNSGHDPN